MSDFWNDKEPCWAIMECSKYLYPKCPAYLHPEIPCWKHAPTQTEKLIQVKKQCTYCKVYRRYNSRDISI